MPASGGSRLSAKLGMTSMAKSMAKTWTTSKGNGIANTA